MSVATALFRIIGKKFRVYDKVLCASSTASDAATGQVADIECLDGAGEVVLGVEVKDKELTLTETRVKITKSNMHQHRS